MHKVLITKELTKKQRAIAHDYHLDPIEQSFIKITFSYDAVRIPKVDAWILTSANAARYINTNFSEFSTDHLPKQIVSIGDATSQHIDHLGIPILQPNYGTAENVVELVKQKGIQSAVFFSGNLRGNTIPDGLAKELDFTEIQVYKTELIDQKLPMDTIKGVAFFSPSGVRGFAQSNSITNQTVIAIGTTTKQEVKQVLGVEAGIPGSTSVEDVLFALKQDLS